MEPINKISKLIGRGNRTVIVRTTTGESYTVFREMDSPLEGMLALSVFPEIAEGETLSVEDVENFDVVLIPLSNVVEIRVTKEIPTPRGGSMVFKAD